MNKTTKVTLLSTLVFPGVGHLVLKRYGIALAFIASSTYLLLSLISDMLDKSQRVIDSITRGEIPLEIEAISQALAEQGILVSQQQTFSGCMFILVWVLAAFDAFRIANKQTIQ
ncbi:MAG: hypothetical protein GY928_36720 [Colwellia sp.]|nr:hypothetical protein [Colwellia sp.]